MHMTNIIIDLEDTFNTSPITHEDLFIRNASQLLIDNTGCSIKQANKYTLKFYHGIINELIRQYPNTNRLYKKINLFGLARGKLSRTMGSFRANKIRYYTFTEIDKITDLITSAYKGDSIDKKLSEVSISPTFHNIILDKITDNQRIYDATYEHYHKELSDPNLFDKVYIDVDSLTSYLNSGITCQLDVRVINRLLQLNSIHGYVPHIINMSDFGRKYYRCINLQVASSDIRRAALPDCIEIDINSCSNEFLIQQANTYGVSCDYLKEYSANKDQLRIDITKAVFGDNYTKDELKIIKQCITALGFGAIMTDRSGNAINKIIKNGIKRAQFINHKFMVGYYNDMSNIGTAVYAANKTKFANMECVKTEKGRLSKSKVMAYLYQHFEHDTMMRAFDGFKSNVKLLVHDGCYVEGLSIGAIALIKERFADMKLTVSIDGV